MQEPRKDYAFGRKVKITYPLFGASVGREVWIHYLSMILGSELAASALITLVVGLPPLKSLS